MNDEVAHLRIVHRLLRLGPPGRMSGRIVRKHADDFHFVEILEGHMLKIGEFTAEHEMKQLWLRLIGHRFQSCVCPAIVGMTIGKMGTSVKQKAGRRAQAPTCDGKRCEK